MEGLKIERDRDEGSGPLDGRRWTWWDSGWQEMKRVSLKLVGIGDGEL